MGSLEIYNKALKSNGEVLVRWDRNDKLEFGDSLISSLYPIGSIYISVNPTNPSELFGGTWERFSNGRVLVGVDENQSEFNTTKKIGGHKALQQHNHSHNLNVDNKDLKGVLGQVYTGTKIENSGIVTGKTDASNRTYSNAGSTGNSWSNWDIDASHKHTLIGSINNAGTGDSGNLQPYITCYIWLRIA